MEAYVILSGGGIKGAALAGCVAAVEAAKFKIKGYGGTSAGAIVALLAAAGYRTREDLQLTAVSEFDQKQLLDDGGEELEAAKKDFAMLFKKRGDYDVIGGLAKLTALWRLKDRVSGNLGLYAGKRLEEFLHEKIKAKLPNLKRADFTFEEFTKAGGTPLRIVASDLRKRRAVVFGDGHDNSLPVLDAVRASAAYPFVYRPINHGERHEYIDGGISSNLPIFLYSEEYLRNRMPVFAFDLVPNTEPGNADEKDKLSHFCRNIFSTALEASDALFQQKIQGVHYIPVEIPDGVDALDFYLDTSTRNHLFEEGYKTASGWLAKHGPTRHIAEAGDNPQRLLQLSYGPKKYYQPVLWAIATELEAKTKAKDVRVTLMLPTRTVDEARMVVYHHNMEGDSDIALTMGRNEGCSGAALNDDNGIVIQDLRVVRSHPEKFGASAAIMEKVPLDRLAMISVAVPGWRTFEELDDDQKQKIRLPRIAVLSVDTVTPLEESGWGDMDPHAPGDAIGVRRDLALSLRGWARIIGKMLP